MLTKNPGRTDVLEETSGTAEIPQWHWGPRPETAATPGKQESAEQEKCQRGPETGRGAGYRKANSRVFDWATK
jgi:hypothetical protein